jgi:hypothetical protein
MTSGTGTIVTKIPLLLDTGDSPSLSQRFIGRHDRARAEQQSSLPDVSHSVLPHIVTAAGPPDSMNDGVPK